MVELIWDDIKVEFWYAGEGLEGDYTGEDDDVALLRFDVMRRAKVDDLALAMNAYEWEHIDDASYCTQIPLDTAPTLQTELAMIIMANIYDHASAGISIKKRCEELSWIDPTWANVEVSPTCS